MVKLNVVDLWTQLLGELSGPFTVPGTVHFASLLTGGALARPRPLVTEIVTALGRQKQWRATEWFLEKGKWPTDRTESTLCSMAAQAPGQRQVWSVDDMKALKSGKQIWGTCSFHEYTSRCSNRPETVWAHNWVVFGALRGGTSNEFLPTMGRLYIREGQRPEAHPFRTKPQMAVEMARQCAQAVPGPHLLVFDGGYAIRTVVRPLIDPPPGTPRVEFLTRLRGDARLYSEPPQRRPGQPGRPRLWGERLAAPQQAEHWDERWHQAQAHLYGRNRSVRYKQQFGQWHPAGPEGRVHAFVFQVEGYSKPWRLVTSDLSLSPIEVLETYAARFAQEDAHRELKQQLGLGTEQGRCKNVVLRSFLLRAATLTLLVLLRQKLNEDAGVWWYRPSWYRQKKRASIRDVLRVLREAKEEFSQLDWRGLKVQKPPGPQARPAAAPPHAA